MAMLTMRSKIAVRWTTNPANFGYDGVASDWKNRTPEMMSVVRASNVRWEISQKIGHGSMYALYMTHNGCEITTAELAEVCMRAEYDKLSKAGKI